MGGVLSADDKASDLSVECCCRRQDEVQHENGDSGTALSDFQRPIATEWERVLGLNAGSVRAPDSFVELGGESLLALRVCAAMHYLFAHDSKPMEEDDPQFGMVDGPFAVAALLQAASLTTYCEHLQKSGCTLDKLQKQSEAQGTSKRTPPRPTPTGEPLLPGLRAAALQSGPAALKKLLDSMPRDEALRWCGAGPRGPGRFTALHAAAQAGSESCVQLLLEKRARPTAVEAGSSMTSAHYAAMNSEGCLRLLLDAKAPLTLRDIRGQSLIHAAARTGNAGSLLVLMGTLRNNGSTKDRASPAGASSSEDHFVHSSRTKVLEWSDRWNRTAVHWAALNGHDEALKILLSHGANPEPPMITAHQMGKKTHMRQETPAAIATRIHGASSSTARLLVAAVAAQQQDSSTGNGSRAGHENVISNVVESVPSKYVITIAEPRLERLAIWELEERLLAKVKRVQCRVFCTTVASPAPFFGLKAAEKVCAVLLYAGAEELDRIIEASKEDSCEPAVAQLILMAASWLPALTLWRRFHDLCDSVESSEPLTFKVTCRRKGARLKAVSSQALAIALASALQTAHGWKAQVRRPDFEIRVLMSDSELLVDLPLLFQGAIRTGGGEICEAGLSAPVAWAMARTAELKPGERVLDPMCGKAVVLIEAALSWPSCHFIGLDIDSEQLRGAEHNIAMLAATGGVTLVDLLHGDARSLPLPDGSVDVIICDIPFGRQYGTIEECRESLYENVLREFDRVVQRRSGRMILLSSLEQEPWVLRAAGVSDQSEPTESNSISTKGTPPWVCIGRRKTPLGFLDAVILVFCRPDLVDPQADESIPEMPALSDRLSWETSAGRGEWASMKVAQRPPMQLARGREI